MRSAHAPPRNKSSISNPDTHTTPRGIGLVRHRGLEVRSQNLQAYSNKCMHEWGGGGVKYGDVGRLKVI